MEGLIYTFYLGFYQLFTIPYHLPLILLGLLIRHKLKSQRAQRIWLGLLALLAIGCLYSWEQVNGFDRLGVCLAWAVVNDLALGTAIIGLPKTIKQFIRWITTNETSDTEGGTP